MILLAGLGNPGDKYEKNRHNVGFMVVDLIAERHGFAPWRSRFQGLTAEGQLGTEKCLLLKPATYMNESGRAIGEALRFYKLDLTDLVVIHDELDLKPGKLKVKTGGGHAGNNGLRSIIAHVGAEFRRLRIGIGHPGDKNKVSKYVLHDFAKADYDWLDPLLVAISNAAPRLAAGDDARFMTEIAQEIAPPKPIKKTEPKNQEKSTADKPAGPKSDKNQDDEPSTALSDKLKALFGSKTKKQD